MSLKDIINYYNLVKKDEEAEIKNKIYDYKIQIAILSSVLSSETEDLIHALDEQIGEYDDEIGELHKLNEFK